MMRGNNELMTNPTELSTASARAGRERRVYRMSAKLSLCLLALTVGLATGCGAGRPSKYYQLTIPGDLSPVANPNPFPVTLLIGRMTGPALYREDEIVYSSGGEGMGTYEYHRWAEPPTEMISEIMLRQLRASGHYRAIYTLRSDVHGDFLLHGRLYDFKEVSEKSDAARVTMELELRNIKTATTVWTHFYSHDEPTTAKNVDAIVAALDKNVQQGIAECRASLDEYFAAHPPAQPAP
jgi:ABC-type uncharacterized transport system auxiliary subunit